MTADDSTTRALAAADAGYARARAAAGVVDTAPLVAALCSDPAAVVTEAQVVAVTEVHVRALLHLAAARSALAACREVREVRTDLWTP